MKILEGKKTLLFPFAPADFDYFFELYEQEKYKFGELKKIGDKEQIKMFLIQSFASLSLLAWVGYTKEGKASRRAGIIYLFDITDRSCSIHGVVDKQFLKGLAKRLKQKDKLTYTEDALRTVLNFCFTEFNRERVDTTIPKNNRLAIALVKKVGFKQEGILREYAKIDDNPIDVVILSILKKEWKG